MNTDLENRLREAFDARTAGVPHPAEPAWAAAGRPRRRLWTLVPAAAVTLVLLLTGTFVRVTLDDGGEEFDPAIGMGPVRPATSPRFAARTDTEAHKVEIVDVPSGKVRGTLTPPAGYDRFWTPITAAADNRTFFFTVVQGEQGRMRVAQVHLDDQGRPGRPVLVAQAPSAADLRVVATPSAAPTGRPSPWAGIDMIAASPDATRLAMVTSSKDGEALAVWDLRTGSHRRWNVPAPVQSIAWDAGRLRWAGASAAGILDPEDPARTVRADRTFPERNDSDMPLLLPSGDRIVLLTAGDEARLTLLPARSGKAPVVLDRWRSDSYDQPVADSTGRHLLYTRGHRIERMDLRTRKHSPTSSKVTKMDPTLSW
ncbi:hypothetical protein [Spirillospora sp. NBC_01491]|uniref:hypothetical protein n=1 Tax=Spirillospora sp. NBC_01491 TaxID=2976007 RepID=UPI002E300BFC|nr:hypothetical protein [Spirillospora sp. NBC_01491]